MVMDDLRQSIEDNYLTFIAIAAAMLAVVAALVWVMTVFVRKVKVKK